MSKEEAINDFINEFIDFMDKHKDKMKYQEIGYLVMRETSHMLFFCSRDREKSINLIQTAINDALEQIIKEEKKDE